MWQFQLIPPVDDAALPFTKTHPTCQKTHVHWPLLTRFSWTFTGNQIPSRWRLEGCASLREYNLDENVAHYSSWEQVLSTVKPAVLWPCGERERISRSRNLRCGLLKAKLIRGLGCDSGYRCCLQKQKNKAHSQSYHGFLKLRSAFINSIQ